MPEDSKKKSGQLYDVYQNLVKSGSEGTYDDFVKFFNGEEQNRKDVYDKLIKSGSEGSYDDFLKFVGYDAPQRVDVSDVERQTPNDSEIPTVTLDDKPTFEEWYKTVPQGKNDTASYDLRKAYDVLPYEDMQKFAQDKDAHLPTVYEDREKDEYPFLKKKDHPTIGKELEWYNSDDAVEFRKKYRLDQSGDYYRYVPQDDYSPQSLSDKRAKMQDIDAKMKKLKEDKAMLSIDFMANPSGAIDIDEKKKQLEKQYQELEKEKSSLGGYFERYSHTTESAKELEGVKESVNSIKTEAGIDDRNFWDKLGDRLELINIPGRDAQNWTDEQWADYHKKHKDTKTKVAVENQVSHIENKIEREEMRRGGELKGLAFWRGLKTADYQDLSYTNRMNDAVEMIHLSKKLENGEDLNEKENALLKSLAISSQVDQNYVDGIMESVGSQFPEQAKFTLEFIIAGGLGAGGVEAAVNAGTKKAMSNVFKKTAGNAAKNFVGDKLVPKLATWTVGGAARTLMNPVGLASSTMERMAGEIAYNENTGQWHFDNQEGFGEAFGKALGSGMIENATELMGADLMKLTLSPLRGTHKALMSDKLNFKGYQKLSAGIENVIDKMKASSMSNVFKISDDVARISGISGVGKEFLEEVYGGILNSLVIGDQSLEQLFSKRNMTETFMSCLSMCGVMSSASALKSGVQAGKHRRETRRLCDEARFEASSVEGFDAETFDKMFAKSSIEDLSKWVNEKNQKHGWSFAERNAVLQYMVAKAQLESMHNYDDKLATETRRKLRQDATDCVNKPTGNIITATITDKDGNEENVTVVDGNVSYRTFANPDGSEGYAYYSSMSDGKVMIRHADGSKEMMRSAEVKGINSVMPLEQQIAIQEGQMSKMLYDQFEKDYLEPSVESLMGKSLVEGQAIIPMLTPDGSSVMVMYIGKDEQGKYIVQNVDADLKPTGEQVHADEKEIKYGLLELISESRRNEIADDSKAEEARLAIEHEKKLLDSARAAKDSKAWEAVKELALKGIKIDKTGEFVPEESDAVYAASYLNAANQGDTGDAIEDVKRSLESKAKELLTLSGQAEETAEGVGTTEYTQLNEQKKAQAEKIQAQIGFLGTVLDNLMQLQELTKSLSSGDMFNIMLDGKTYRASFETRDSDGTNKFWVMDEDGNPAMSYEMNDKDFRSARDMADMDSQQEDVNEKTENAEEVKPEKQEEQYPAPVHKKNKNGVESEEYDFEAMPEGQSLDVMMQPDMFDGNAEKAQRSIAATIDKKQKALEAEENKLSSMESQDVTVDEIQKHKALVEKQKAAVDSAKKSLDYYKGLLDLAVQRYGASQNAESGNTENKAENNNDAVEDNGKEAEIVENKTDAADEVQDKTKEQLIQDVADAVEMDEKGDSNYINDNLNAAKKKLDNANKRTPKATDKQKRIEELNAINQERKAAEAEVERWTKAKEAYNGRQNDVSVEPTYRQRIEKVGEPQSAWETLLLDIAKGRKFSWGNRERRGIGDLFKYSENERRRKIRMLNSTTGFTVENYVEHLMGNGSEYSHWFEGMSVQDVTAMVEDALLTTYSSSDALEKIESARKKAEEDYIASRQEQAAEENIEENNEEAPANEADNNEDNSEEDDDGTPEHLRERDEEPPFQKKLESSKFKKTRDDLRHKKPTRRQLDAIIDRLKKSGLAKDVKVFRTYKQAYDYINKTMGTSYRFDEKRKAFGGVYLNNGEVVIVTEGVMLDTAFHEFAHALMTWAVNNKNKSKEATALYEAIMKYIKEAPDAVKDYVKKKYGAKEGNAEYIDEVFAWALSYQNLGEIKSFIESRGVDTGNLEEFAEVQAWYSKVWEAVKKLWNSVKNAFAGGKYADLSVFEAYEDMSAEQLGKKMFDVLMGGKEIGGDVEKNNEETRFQFSTTPQDFDAMQKMAVEMKGVVSPNLNSTSVSIVDVPKHDFIGTGNDAIKKARQWANENLIGERVAHKGTVDEFNYNIDEKAIKKYLSNKSILSSDNLGVHLAVLKLLPKVIDNSIEAEIHADYRKNNGERSSSNGLESNDVLIHRLYGAAHIEDDIYRVKTTIKEKKSTGNKPYSYEVTKIELIISGSSQNNGTSLSDALKSSISAAKLLQNVEKSYDKGKKLLDESKNIRFQITSEQDRAYMEAAESGDMETAQRMVDEAAKMAMPDTKIVDENGKLLKVYHNTNSEFTVFDKKKIGSATDNGIWGRGFYFAKMKTNTYGDRQMACYLNIKNPLDINKYETAQDISNYLGVDKSAFKDKDGRITIHFSQNVIGLITSAIKRKGHDGCIVSLSDKWTEYVVFSSSQIKSADPVTYDDNGNVIPLSKRFNDKEDDIRFQIASTDSNGRELSEGQRKFFNDSKVVDEKGRLREVYHYTNWNIQSEEKGKAVFDENKIGSASGDLGWFGKGFYFGFYDGEASYYGKNRLACYLNIKKPFVYADELETYGGIRAKFVGEVEETLIANLWKKFPNLIKGKTMRYFGAYNKETDSYEQENVSYEDFAKTFDDVFRNKDFEASPVYDYNEKIHHYRVVTDPYTVTSKNGDTFTEYKYEENFTNKEDAENRLTNTAKYLEKVSYPKIDYPSSSTIIQETELSNELKKQGYDGILQTLNGDEVVAFYPNQIKDVDNLNPTENEDIRFQLRDDGSVSMNIVYHGSPYDFEKFMLDKIGTGEGNQSYGRGLYTTDVEGIARGYAKANANTSVEVVLINENGITNHLKAAVERLIEGKSAGYINKNKDKIQKDVANLLSERLENNDEEIKDVQSRLKASQQALDIIPNLTEEQRERFEADVRYYQNWIESTKLKKEANEKDYSYLEENGLKDFEFKPTRNLYTISIPIDNGSNYLQWDKPVKANQFKAIISQLRNEKGKEEADYFKKYKSTDGSNVYTQIASTIGTKEASELLYRAGLAGISYPAEAMTGGRADNARNYVLFNENDLEIKDHVRFQYVEEVNDKFNEELATITTENANNKIFSLGTPSNILKSSGIADKELKLYGSKLAAKAKKHGFKFEDVKDLPKSIQQPIAVFKGSELGSHAILTEININGYNTLVSLGVGKNNDIDFNLISSVYGKSEKGVINWINNGKMLYANKTKALDYLRISALNAEAQDKQELSLAAKIIQNFENPSISEEKDENIRFQKPEQSEQQTDSERIGGLRGEVTRLGGKAYADQRTLLNEIFRGLNIPISLDESEDRGIRFQMAVPSDTVARDRNMDREAYKKAFKKNGEKAYDMLYEFQGGTIAMYPNEFLEYLKSKVGVADDLIGIIKDNHDWLVQGFRRANPSLFEKEKNAEEFVPDVKDVLAKKGYSIMEHTMDNGKALGVKFMYRDKFVESGKTDKTHTPDREWHSRSVICYYNHPESRLDSQYVFTVEHENAMNTPTAYELAANPKLVTKEWETYLENTGRKNEDGTYNLNGLEPDFNDPFSLSFLMIRIGKGGSHGLEVISRYNHGAFASNGKYSSINGQPNATLNLKLDKLVSGFNKSLMAYKNIKVTDKDIMLASSYRMANDGKVYKCVDERNGVYIGSGFYIDNQNNAHVIDANKERLAGFLLFGNNTVADVSGIFSITITPHSMVLSKNRISFMTGGEKVVEKKDIKLPDGSIRHVEKEVWVNDEKTEITFGEKTEIFSECEDRMFLDLLATNIYADGATFSKIETTGDDFLFNAKNLKSISLPNVKTIKNRFLRDNNVLESINLPNVKIIGDDFLRNNNDLESISLPKVETIGDRFLFVGGIRQIVLPNVKTIGDDFLHGNMALESVSLPNVETIGDSFLFWNNYLWSIDLPEARTIGCEFLNENRMLESITLPKVKSISYDFLVGNNGLRAINLPKATEIGSNFLGNNKKLKSYYIPNVESIGVNFLINSLVAHSAEEVRERSIKFKEETEGKSEESSDSELRFQLTDTPVIDDGILHIRENYEKSVRGKYNTNIGENIIEKWFDGLEPLKRLENEIISKGENITFSEDAYRNELARTSKTTRLIENNNELYTEPLMTTIGNIWKYGRDNNIDLGEDAINRYLIAKHGLERNEYFFNKRKADNDNLPFEERVVVEMKDVSGLRGLAEAVGKNADDYTEVAKNIVEEFESKVGRERIVSLWNKINALTNQILLIDYNAGIWSKDKYEMMRDRFKFYVPLRGWGETTSDEFYEYHDKEGRFTNSRKFIKGRESLADDPVVFMVNMLQSSIVASQKNEVMKCLYRLALNHKSDLIKLQRSFYYLNGSEWVEVYPDIEKDATTEEINASIEAFKDDMALKKEQGFEVKSELNHVDVGMKVKPFNENEHIVQVWIAGKKYGLIINGNPSAFNCLRKSDELDNKVFNAIRNATGWISRMNTTYSPEFFVRNMARDMAFASFSSLVEGGISYCAKINKNMFAVMPVLAKLIATGKCGDKDMEQYWKEFLDNGGETGYTRTLAIDQQKKNIDKMIKRAMNGKSIDKKGYAEFMEQLNRWGEDVSRFAAYVTNRKDGKNIGESITAAKEITINFSRKGNGVAASIFRSLFSFFNAGMQGLYRTYTLAKEHPGRFIATNSSILVTGFIIPLTNVFLLSLFGDDDDWKQYKYLNDYTANNNFVIFTGDGFLTIPYPQELAPVFSVGNVCMRHWFGWSNKNSIAEDIIDSYLELSPVKVSAKESNKEWKSFVKRAGINITPSIARPLMENILNFDFMGRQIYKDTPYNENAPSWTKANENTWKIFTSASKWINHNDAVQKRNGWVVDVLTNPASVQHLLEGMLGGTGRFVSNVYKFVEEDYDINYFPWLRTLYLKSDPVKYAGGINKEYNHFMYDVAEKTSDALKGYKDQYKEDIKNPDLYKSAQATAEMYYNIAGSLEGTIMQIYESDYVKNTKELEKKYYTLRKGGTANNDELDKMRENIMERKMYARGCYLSAQYCPYQLIK